MYILSSKFYIISSKVFTEYLELSGFLSELAFPIHLILSLFVFAMCMSLTAFDPRRTHGEGGYRKRSENYL